MKIGQYYSALGKKEKCFIGIIASISLFSIIFTTVSIGTIGVKIIAFNRAALPVDMEMPPVALRDANGNRINLADYSHQKRLFFFFKPQCPACRLELANVQYVFRTYSSEKIRIFSVSEADEEETRRFLSTYSLGFSVLMDPKASLRKTFGFFGTPALFLVGEDNVIRYGHVGYRKLEFDKMLVEEFIRSSKVPIEALGPEDNLN